MTEQNSGDTPTSSEDLNAKKKLKQAFRQAICMATKRLGATWPNPPVGCAILDKDGKILSLAAHCSPGEAHAEILALETLNRWGLAEKAACLIVTLEPCNHHGKTPPCVEALLKTNIPEIWIGAADPNATASGGAERLAQAGKRVFRLWESKDPYFQDLIEDCQALITPFSTRISQKRPWIILKQALDETGSMIPPKGTKTFTSQAALELAHLLRRSCGGIITGRGTILADQPLFTIRRVPDFENLPQRWIIACGQQALPLDWIEARLKSGFHFLQVTTPQEAVETLAKAGVEMALIEAGPQLLQAFRDSNLVDEFLKIHKGPQVDYLEWEKQNASPSPLTLLEKYSPDWPKHLPLIHKKALTICPEVFKSAHSHPQKNESFLWLKSFFSKFIRRN